MATEFNIWDNERKIRAIKKMWAVFDRQRGEYYW